MSGKGISLVSQAWLHTRSPTHCLANNSQVVWVAVKELELSYHNGYI